MQSLRTTSQVARYLLVGLTLVAMRPGLGEAQRQRRGEVSLLAGPAFYNFGLTGTKATVRLGFSWRPFGRVLVLEPSFGYFSYNTSTEGLTLGDSRWLFSEASVQVEGRLGSTRPYVGIGGGGGRERLDGRSQREPTLLAITGIRVDLGTNWGARAEARLRSIDPFAYSLLEFGIGLSRRDF